MKDCNFKNDELAAYCYGELGERRTKEIKEHLAACNKCSSSVRALKGTISFAQQQKLKKCPSHILSNYTQEIRERIREQKEAGLIPVFRQKALDFLESLHLGFYPRLIPALASVCVVVFAVAFLQYNRINSVNLVNQDIALLDSLGEDIDEASFYDSSQLAEEIEHSDRIVLAQLDKDIESSGTLEDIAILQALDEEALDSEDLIDDVELLDEIDSEQAIG